MSNILTNPATTTSAPFAPPGTAAQMTLHPLVISIYPILMRMRQTPQPQNISSAPSAANGTQTPEKTTYNTAYTSSETRT